MKNSKRIWLNESYAIHRYKGLKLWYLEHYRFGKNHMPDEIYADEDIKKVYDRFLSIVH